MSFTRGLVLSSECPWRVAGCYIIVLLVLAKILEGIKDGETYKPKKDCYGDFCILALKKAGVLLS